MEASAGKEHREEIFSRAVRAGKRTYFFDVKQTRSKELFLTITESKRHFDNDSGNFVYEKHKIFLYREDFDKFANGLNAVIEFIETGKTTIPDISEELSDETGLNNLPDIEFDDLEK